MIEPISPADVVDADGHVYENDLEIFEHLEPPYAGKRTLLGFPLFPSLYRMAPPERAHA